MQGVDAIVSSEENRWNSYCEVRALTEQLVEPLSAEDQTIQSMPDASPAKWHLAHSSWFFETFILREYLQTYSPFDEQFATLFNSYYNQIGDQYARVHRGMITRPSVDEVMSYRRHVDEAVHQLFESQCFSGTTDESKVLIDLMTLGLNHEQQHQELLLMDIKHAFSFNPVHPVYTENEMQDAVEAKIGIEVNRPSEDIEWQHFEAGIYQVGVNSGDAEGSFCFDNETPRHRVYQESFGIASRPVINSEYVEFIDDGGYQNPNLWLSDGWTWVSQSNGDAPLYWQSAEGDWNTYTLGGLKPLVPNEPVIHLSYFEADAFARWAGHRLPTEHEWEIAASTEQQNKGKRDGFLNTRRCHPGLVRHSYFGDAWCWTSTAYSAYPGFRVPDGAIGEYNGKFMCNQFVLRGGSCVTPADHIRSSYRNFFPATAQWQFSGLRLAKDA